MNYLGHAFLSLGKQELLVGNMIGDYVKGSKKLDDYPPGIQKGIVLHRQIDEFTDKHMATTLAKNIFRPDYGLYSGAIVDVLWDYFLANDPRFFQTEEDLYDFSISTYKQIAFFQDLLPADFKKAFEYMQGHNWLYNYRNVKGMEKALNGLAYKAQYLNDASRAYALFLQYYYELNQRYFEFIDDVVAFVKNKHND